MMKVQRAPGQLNRQHVSVAAMVFVAAMAGMLLLWRARPRVSEDAIRNQMVAAIQREARASLLVTGALDITVTITHQSTRTLLPGIVDLGLGTARATVQVPGRAFYGLDVRTIAADDIDIRGDTIRLHVPQPSVLSVEPNLAEMRTWTSKGWLRTPASVREAQEAAIRQVNGGLMRQARSYLATSSQPSINTARALKTMLRPPLVAAGIRNPKFKFELGERLVLE